MKQIVSTLALALFAIMFVVVEPAHAYLDPGSGALILQLVLSGVAGLMVVGKIFWSSLKAPFVRSELEIDVQVSESAGSDGVESEEQAASDVVEDEEALSAENTDTNSEVRP